MIRAVLLSLAVAVSAQAEPPPRPNILWISIEDASPDFGCYGDRYAISPVIDRLASQGTRYTRCFTHAPVCAPSRSGIITGMYPTATGAHNMRCKAVPAPEVKCFTEYLRAAGYYCTNNVKTDYQFEPPVTAWDENSNKAHWRNKASGQPFFAVFNFTTTHESQVRDPSPATKELVARLTPEMRHDPAKAPVPPFYPDTPAVRRDIANSYDNLTAVEIQVAQVLRELDEDGLDRDTIVWFWGDHGRGLPRYKRWCYDSGTRAPLIVRVPEKFKALARPDDPGCLAPGIVDDNLVAFVDFAPTVLSLAGLEAPPHFQGQAFLGPKRTQKPRAYAHSARDRMDERYDLIRSVRDTRYRYVRNFMPWLTRAQHVSYGDQMPTLREMRRLFAAGKLAGPELAFFEPTKPFEELYDTEADPHETRNLATDPKHAEVLFRMREELERWMTSTGDIGFIPEAIFDDLQRPGGKFEATEPPAIVRIEPASDDRAAIVLQSPTPGASVSWRPAADSPWRVASGPFEVPKGSTIQAVASRIGFKKSPVATLAAVEPASQTPESAPAEGPDHWRKRFPEGAYALAMEGLGGGIAALGSANLPAEDTPEAAIRRWWGIASLRQSRGDLDTWREATDRLRDSARSDPSPAVRVAAAGLLCELNDEEAGLPVLVEHLGHPRDAVRHAAVLALDAIGERAKPARTALEAAKGDPYEYVKRVATGILERWDAKP
jgi:N-sulfoglucosamine sulfohydrolase